MTLLEFVDMKDDSGRLEISEVCRREVSVPGETEHTHLQIYNTHTPGSL